MNESVPVPPPQQPTTTAKFEGREEIHKAPPSPDMTWRGKRPRKRKAAKAPPKATPRSRRICAGRSGCSARHVGAILERPCVVCAKPTFHLRTVAAWDAPCCEDHDLARDYRVAVILRPFAKDGQRVTFRAERKIEIVTA